MAGFNSLISLPLLGTTDRVGAKAGFVPVANDSEQTSTDLDHASASGAKEDSLNLWGTPPTKDAMTSAASLRTSRLTAGFQRLCSALLVTMALNTEFVLAQPFRMRAAPPAVPSSSSRQAFESRIDEQARLLASDGRFRRLSQHQRQDAVEFVAGNVLIMALHQLGLALLSEFRLPALGGAEQAADDFAILTALELGKTHFSDRILMQAAKSSFTSKQRKRTARGTFRSMTP